MASPAWDPRPSIKKPLSATIARRVAIGPGSAPSRASASEVPAVEMEGAVAVAAMEEAATVVDSEPVISCQPAHPTTQDTAIERIGLYSY